MTDLQNTQYKALDALLQQAVTLHQVGQVYEAEQLYRRILQSFPKHVDANYNLGLIANLSGHHDAALKHLQVAYDAFPANEQFVLTYANALANQGYLLDAMKIVKAARKQGPDSDELKKAQRQIDEAITLSLENPSPTQKEWEPLPELLKAQNWQELESRAHKLSGKYNRSGKVWAMLAVALQSQGKDFLDEKRKAVRFSPADINLHINLSSDLMALGRHEEVEELLRNLVKNHPDSELTHYNLGVFLNSTDRVLEAGSSLSRTLEINPNYIAALCTMTQLLLKSGQTDKATETMERALAVKTSSADDVCTLAQTLLNLGQLELAAQQFKKAIDLNPQHLPSLNDLGVTLKALGYREDAEKCFYRAIEVLPTFVLALNNLGQMRLENNDIDNALVCFKRSVDLNPNNVSSLLNLAVAFLGQNKFSEAGQCLERAITLAPGEPMLHHNMGLALQGLGQLEAALQSFQNAIRCNPDFAFAYANIGNILATLGQAEQAEQAYSKALELDPQDPRILSLALMAIPYRADDARFAQLETLYAQRATYGEAQRKFLCMAYAKAMEQCGELEKAKAAISEGNGETPAAA